MCRFGPYFRQIEVKWSFVSIVYRKVYLSVISIIRANLGLNIQTRLFMRLWKIILRNQTKRKYDPYIAKDVDTQT